VTAISIARVERLDLRLSGRPWPFAQARRAEIDAHFAGLQRANPTLWNGRVLLNDAFEVADGVARGSYFETDFASFIAWRDWGFPDLGVRNCFAMGALQAEDGAFLLGVMAPHTSNPGWIYFPAGTPDPDDVRPDGSIDLAGSVLRELAEETGIAAAEVEPAKDWTAVFVEPRVAVMKIVRARGRAEELRRRILRHLAQQRQPELCGIHIARGLADLHAQMPPWVAAFLRHIWR
jgi:8-oxo-dGTP pyrophosphatase MutT (NUDIX family)